MRRLHEIQTTLSLRHYLLVLHHRFLCCLLGTHGVVDMESVADSYPFGHVNAVRMYGNEVIGDLVWCPDCYNARFLPSEWEPTMEFCSEPECPGKPNEKYTCTPDWLRQNGYTMLIGGTGFTITSLW